MNIKEAKKKCNDNGIYQLNKGETLLDALNSIDNGTSIKGYKVKHDSGLPMSKNQIIAEENKVAFNKFTPPVFNEDEVESIEDICDSEDMRENKNERGVIIHCFYCGDCLRVDEDWLEDDIEDYPQPIETVHCDGCMKAAISRMCM